MYIVLFILGFILLLIFVFKLVIAKHKAETPSLKTWLLFLVAIILTVLAFFTIPDKYKISDDKETSKTTTSVTKSASSNTIEKLKGSINDALLKNLEQDQGFATGKLDANGNKLPQGQSSTPSASFAWSLAVNKMEYYDAGVSAVKVYLTQDAIDKLSTQDVYQVAKSAQGMIASTLLSDVSNNDKEQKLINNQFNLDDSTKLLPYVSLANANGDELVHTSLFTHQFKQKDFDK
ncbi:hypothetical protein [Periweissella fabalis]|uniref:Uncharacterized protein n=1 Tax=Periweissella fabalis TaxID=1070421 RepID=A0A7X6N4L9_9LACO|nr:hypothetical protein [Periweissella fabalis]MCM0598328.1 hypothetical protein [Periweissella fabalis]NKZ24960.1 hypothetical protein [Periweissella fabalis]